MSIADQQIASIRRAQANSFGAQTTGDTPNEISFVVQTITATNTSDVEAQLKEEMPGIGVSVEPVFLDEKASTFFIVTLPGSSFDDLPGSPFDLAYKLEASLGYVSVEPDIETDFVDWNGAGASTQFGAASTLKSRCFIENEPDPSVSDLGWALRMIKVDQARSNHNITGKGIKIAHIDTGIAQHVETANIDVASGLNLVEKTAGAWDPLIKDGIGHNPGHGTATSSVIVSNGGLTSTSTSAPGRVSGVAPNANLFPIRAIKTVVRLKQGKVARAIDEARKAKAHVITMSLGGLWSWALRAALKKAVKANIIVLAAAGNCVREVVFPARFSDCIAVAGMNEDKEPWRGTSRGSEVDFCAPGQFVWCARRNASGASTHNIGPGQGTSFAVALSAGVASLWLEKHGRSTLIKSLGKNETLQDRFRSVAKATAQQAPKIPRSLGAGFLDANALMQTSSAKGFGAATTRTGAGNIIEKDALAMLTGSSNKSFGASSTGKAKITHSDLEDVAGEVIWRVLLEARARSEQGRSEPLPPKSERLSIRLSNVPNLSVWVP